MGVLSQLPPTQDKAQGPSRADRVFIRQAEDEAPGSTGKIVSRAKVDIAALVQSYEISLRKRGGEPLEMAQSPTAAKPFITILLRLEPQKAAVQKG
jgi:hypothetical protein